MKWISNLYNDPAAMLTMIIIIISICVIGVVVLLLYRLHNEKRVTRAATELKKITNSIRAGLVHFVLEENCRILYASKGFYDLLGYDKLEAKEENKISLLDFISESGQELLNEIQKQLDRETIRCDVSMSTSQGFSLSMLMNGNSSVGRDGKHTISAVFVDISEQKKLQDMILLEGERYRIATELSKDIIFEYHIRTDEMQHSDKFREQFGTNPIIADFTKACMLRRDSIHPDDWGIYLELCQELADGKSIIEVELRMKDLLGEYIWCQLMGKTIYDDHKDPVRVVGRIVNIDTQKKELEALEYKATRDPLTGVYNKEVTIKKIDKFISGNRTAKHMLMLIDFDDFKSINDTYGHLKGDKVLSFIIARIKEVFNEGEIIGRIGGDEFVVFSGNIEGEEEVLNKAGQLKYALNTTYVSDNKTIPISGSIGISLYPESGLHYEQLMDRADQALYRVKEQGKRNYMLYSSSI